MKMNENGRDKKAAWTPLFFSLTMVIGMILGFNLRDTLRNKRDVVSVLKRNDRLEEIIDLINENYVDTVNSNLLYKNAISGILKNLDPHTIYIPADEVAEENDDLEGTFSGIGVEFSIVRDTIEVTSVIEKGPASNAGVALGDQLIKVSDSLVAGNNITSERILHLLRGKQQTSVAITFRNAENGGIKNASIIRDIITVNSVEAYLMLDDTTGYIKINKFSANTYAEFIKALSNLQTKGATQLVVDLRDNPGGYLEAATSIADEFLNDKKLIVYTKGIHNQRTEYRSGEKGKFEAGRLAILIDEGAASASEILAGAIQDWDRGLIIGRRSFGKGLVQEQYEMTDGAGLRLTIAKYYTPAGRCIQRSYAKGREAYRADYEKRFETGELIGKEIETIADTTPFYTANNRKVFGGGGIKPDIFVPYDTARTSATISSIVYSQEAKTATWDFFIHNRPLLQYKTLEDFMLHFNNEAQIAQKYLTLISPDKLKDITKTLKKGDNERFFKVQLKAQIARLLFHENGYYSVMLKEDNVIKKTMDVINSDTYSKIITGK